MQGTHIDIVSVDITGWLTVCVLYMLQVGLPTADLDCDLAQYVELICGKY